MNILKVFNSSTSKYLFQIYMSRVSFCIKRDQISNKLNEPIDKLMINLKYPNNVDDLLKEIEMNNTIMNDMHALQALRSLFELQKNNRSNLSKNYLRNSQEVSILTTKLFKISPSIPINDVIDVLKIATYFEMSSKSVFIQSLLQLIRHDINKLSLRKIMFTSFLLEKLEKNPLIDALLIALPIVFNTKVPKEVDLNDIEELTELLKYTSFNSSNTTSSRIILEMISNHTNQIQLKSAFEIYMSMTRLNLRDFQSFTYLLMNILKENITKLRDDQMKFLLRKMMQMFQQKKFELYNEELFTKLTNNVFKNAKKDNNLPNLLDVISVLNQINFEHEDISKFIIDWYNENPDKRNQISISNIILLLNFVTMGDVNHPNLHKFLDRILDDILQLNEDYYSQMPWIKIAFCVIKYKKYNRQLLEKLFSKSYIENILKSGNNKAYFAKLLMLKQLILTFCPENRDVLPNDDVFDSISNKLELSHDFFFIKELFEVAFGGKSYVLSNLKTDYGYNINHTIIMRKGGYPAAMDVDKIKSLNDIQKPNDGTIVAIMVYPSSCYLVNSKKLKNHFELFLSLLEYNNILTLTIALDLWNSLPNHEKISYVVQSIKLKMNEKDQMCISSN